MGDSDGMRAVQNGGCLTIANGSNYVCGIFLCFIYLFINICIEYAYLKKIFLLTSFKSLHHTRTFVAKVSMAFMGTFYDQTIVVEECVVRRGCKDGHQKDTCLKKVVG